MAKQARDGQQAARTDGRSSLGAVVPLRSSRAFVIAVPMVVILLVLVAGALPAQGTRDDDGALTVYSEAQYGGPHATLLHDTPALEPIGANNHVSSVRINGGDAAWELCDQANYGGRCLLVPRSEPDLASGRWSGRVSSARRIHGTGAPSTGVALSGIVLFSEPHFGGRSQEITTVQQRSLADSALQVRSVRARAGTWEVCEAANFRGRCALVAGEIADVRAIGFPDHVGSLRLHVNLR